MRQYRINDNENIIPQEILSKNRFCGRKDAWKYNWEKCANEGLIQLYCFSLSFESDINHVFCSDPACLIWHNIVFGAIRMLEQVHKKWTSSCLTQSEDYNLLSSIGSTFSFSYIIKLKQLGQSLVLQFHKTIQS